MNTLKRNLSLLLIVITGVYGCDNDIIDEMSSSEIQQEKLKQTLDFQQGSALQTKLNQPEFEDFVKTFEEFVVKMQEINSQKNPEDLQELTNLHKLCMEQPDEYLVILETNINSIYTNDEMEIIKKLFSDMEKAGENLTVHTDFSMLSQNERDDFNHVLATKIPQLQSRIPLLDHPNRIKTRSESNDCAERCEESYYYDLLAIASAAICSGAAAIIVSCSSLGTMTIPALIGAISAVAGTSVSIDIATAHYKNCLKGC